MLKDIRVLAAVFGSIAVQLGLAVLGWGGWNAFWAHPAFQALAGVTVMLTVVSLFSSSRGLSSGEKEDKSGRWVLGAFTVIALIMTYFSAYTDRINFWTLGGEATRWAGVVICFGGGVLRIAPVFVLKERFSGLVAIQKGHRLETHGLYALVRNPSYLGMILTSLG